MFVVTRKATVFSWNSEAYTMRDMATIPAAPGALDHPSIALVNSLVTLPAGESTDELASPAEAAQWLITHKLAPADTELLAYCRSQLVGLRANVRALFSAQVRGEPPGDQAMEAINAALARISNAPLLRYSPDRGLRRVVEQPVTKLVEHAMALLAEDAAELLTGEGSMQLAQCEAAPCERFLIRTHARRRWCSTRCGDRIRAARAYARRRK